jgi:outer membrane protein assembly factor BamB
MYKSLDGGESWIARASSQNIADFAVQDATTIYVASSAFPYVVKSTTGASIWNTASVAFATGVCYSLNLLADNQVIVGGNGGWVSYSADGTVFTPMPIPTLTAS